MFDGQKQGDLRENLALTNHAPVAFGPLQEGSIQIDTCALLGSPTIREQPGTTKSRSGRLQLGTKMTLHLNWNPMDVGLVVTEFDSPTNGRQTPARIAWAADSSAKGFPSWLLYVERVIELHEFEEGDGEECQIVTQVVSWESQRGPLAYVVRWFMAKNFKMCLRVRADDMTSFVEGEKASS